jgi:hypothetical protein
LAISNAQKKATNQEKIMREVRQATEVMARQIRLATIDYEVYGQALAQANGQTVLHLTDNNDSVSYWLEGNRIKYRCNDESDFLTASDVSIDKLWFYISPVAPQIPNPWPTRVTIILQASRAGSQGTLESLNVQTTVELRRYD